MAQQSRIPSEPWHRTYMPCPRHVPAGLRLVPLPALDCGAADRARAALGLGGAWPLPSTLAEEQDERQIDWTEDEE